MQPCTALGYLASEADRVACALHELAQTLRSPAGANGFGLAHYVDDRLLLNLKPHVVPQATPVEDLLGPLRTTTFLCSFHGDHDVGPFKFRSWAFAMRGGTPSAALHASLTAGLPDVLKRNIGGESLGEAVFHRFLATLEESARLDDLNLPAKAVEAALKSTLGLLDGQGALLMVSNGRMVAGTHNGGGLAYNLREGILACQRCAMDRHALDSFTLRESHRRFKGVMLAGGFGTPPPGFLPVPAGQTVHINRKLEVQLA